ncbi:hypothetical protein CUMW_217650 [Citrus unshiu]|uniref:Uncharacterized protein n=1 Tax=Citrus unshiu TaxID=55188 RepID=A0A2H5QCW6_CITUN|nr:hypothetical protein CUMW_217650 [Citrus unshiu]
MLDVHLRLFRERLKRVLAGEEGTLPLPDSTNLTPLFQNLLTESEIIATTLLGKYEVDMARHLFQLLREDFDELLDLEESDEEDVERADILEILEDINDFVHESEEAIDRFFINIMQQQNSENESESSTDMALLVGLHTKIIDIRNRMQQLPPGDNGFDISEKSNEIIRLLNEGQPRLDINEFQRGREELFDLLIEKRNEIIRLLSEGQPQLDISEFERGREKFFDLLIEGPSGLSVVAILDSSGFDKTAFAADTYNNNHVKFYFDCHAWVRVSIAYDFGKILDDIIKSVMPPSRVSVIIGEHYQLKKSVLRDYLTNKKYFIVLDDVFDYSEIWSDLEEVLPDNENGSRVLILVTEPELLTSLKMENGEKIRLDSVLIGGPLIRLKLEAWQFFVLHYGSMPLGNYLQGEAIPTVWRQTFSVMELPFHLNVCCIYLCVFPPSIEISTRQLYQLWVAEGFIPYNSEETAEHYLKELIHRGFIQVSKRSAGGTIKACYVPKKTGFVWMLDMEDEPPENVKRKIWSDLEKVLPDNQNGSRVLMLVSDPHLLASLEMENGEKIRRDSVLFGGPLIRLKHEAWQFFILHYGSMPLENYVQGEAIPTVWRQIFSVMELPFHLKVCCIYLCVFPPSIEMSTRQLYQLWVAEGFIPYNDEETAEHYLKELIHRGFIQVSKRSAGGTIKACYVPSLEFTSLYFVAKKTGFVLTPEMEEESVANVKRCFIVERLIDFFPLEYSDMRLQSFLNHSSESDRLALIDCENFCKKFKHLQVLNLGFAVLDQYPPGLENLYLLKYLKLNIPSVKCLPSLLCNSGYNN